MIPRRLPIESAQPLLLFAVARLAIVGVALIASVALDFPSRGAAIAVIAGAGLPWALVCLHLGRTRPELLLSPLVAAGDLAILVALEAAAPATYGGVRGAALFLIAAHAHFQGELRGVAVALLGGATLVAVSAAHGDAPIPGDMRAFYETVFVLSALATSVVVGSLRTAESAGRLRARGLSRRSIQAEADVRRRVAEMLHDGPVQELIGLDMMLSSARAAAGDGRRDDAVRLLDDAREVTERNITALRDELVQLGPYAFAELGFATAVGNCVPAWKRRYGFEVLATIEDIDISPQAAGDLFGIVQEAVVNAGRHAGADAVSIDLRSVGDQVELRVTDNGSGFGDGDPFEASPPGHVGLAMMRERAELLGGSLDIEASERGTRVIVLIPAARATA